MTGRTRFGPNIIDTEQIIDDSISYAKLSTAAKASITSAAQVAALVDAKVADKLVVKYASVNCYQTGTVVNPICTVPSISIVTDVITITEAAITPGGTGTQTVGDAGAADGFLVDANITKTLNAVSGIDPATRGAYLYTPGAQSGETPFAVSTWAHPTRKIYMTDTVINCTTVKGTNTAGTLGVYVFYMKVVPS